MRGRLFTLLSAVSLALCVATCVLWVRSYWYEDILSDDRSGRIVSGQSLRGRVAIIHTRRVGGPSAPQPDDGLRLNTVPAGGAIVHSLSPVGWRRQRIANAEFAVSQSFVFVSNWLICAGGAVLPALWVVRARRRRRVRAGLCRSCGYDLRATPDRCPECGVVAASGGT